MGSTSWTHSRYCAAAGREVARLAEVAAATDPQLPLPTCPEWTVVDLLRHVGEIHRWAAAMVRNLSASRLRREDIDWDLPADPAGFPAWIAAGGPPMVAAFEAADPAAPMWAWGADQHVRFWPRRMLHETSVHRGDVELALGLTPRFDNAVAVDTVDELLANLPCAAYFAPRVEELRGTGERIRFAAADVDQRWEIRLHADGFDWERHEGGVPGAGAEVTLEADRLVDLVLLVYGRRSLDAVDARIEGDLPLLRHWLTCSAI